MTPIKKVNNGENATFRKTNIPLSDVTVYLLKGMLGSIVYTINKVDMGPTNQFRKENKTWDKYAFSSG